jgi:hypothetical protein
VRRVCAAADRAVDQDVQLMVFSYLDMGFLASIGLLLSVGLLAYGRPYIFKQIWDFRKRLIPTGRGLQPTGQTNLLQKIRAWAHAFVSGSPSRNRKREP